MPSGKLKRDKKTKQTKGSGKLNENLQNVAILARIPIPELLFVEDGVLERGGASLEWLLGLGDVIHGANRPFKYIKKKKKTSQTRKTRQVLDDDGEVFAKLLTVLTKEGALVCKPDQMYRIQLLYKTNKYKEKRKKREAYGQVKAYEKGGGGLYTVCCLMKLLGNHQHSPILSPNPMWFIIIFPFFSHATRSTFVRRLGSMHYSSNRERKRD